MRVSNVHERELNATVDEVGALVNSLASGRDGLWPGAIWPSMRLDRPLGVGAAGGHGPVRYVVEAFDPGRMVKFRFTEPKGFDGHHWFEVVPRGERFAVLRHSLQIDARGSALISWPLVFRPLHDALIEDALALAQTSLGLPSAVRPWSPWVQFLRWVLSRGKVRRQSAPRSIAGGS